MFLRKEWRDDGGIVRRAFGGSPTSFCVDKKGVGFDRDTLRSILDRHGKAAH